MADARPKAEKVTPPGTGDPTAKPGAKKRGPGRPKGSGTNIAKLEGNLEELFGMFAFPFFVVGDTHCSEILTNGAPKLAKAYAELAKNNAGVYRFLTSITEGSAWGGVVFTTLSVALPIAQHHSPTLARVPNPFNMGAALKRTAEVHVEDDGQTYVPEGDQVW
jgi:hypothetical protein